MTGRTPAGAGPRPPKADLSGLLVASMEEVVRIEAGEVPPSRVHKAPGMAARAAARAVEQGWEGKPCRTAHMAPTGP